VSNFELNQTADGAFELIGEMSFETVAQILKSSEQSFAQHAETWRCYWNGKPRPGIGMQ